MFKAIEPEVGTEPHIDSFFMGNFIRDMKEKYGQDFYVFGEFWNPDKEANLDLRRLAS